MARKAHSAASSLVYFTGHVSVPAEDHFILKTVVEWSHDTLIKAVIPQDSRAVSL